jgi:chemotaxis protein MotB
MARRHKHEEHQNHEAWATPYGDLITLLLAFFVVMYSMSSVNEGKYRILSDSLVAAFRGQPKTVSPIQIGTSSAGGKGGGTQQLSGGAPTALLKVPDPRPLPEAAALPTAEEREGRAALERMAGEVRVALQGLIDAGDVRIRETRRWLEVEVNTDILFGSGDARVAELAVPVVARLAGILAPFPNPIRVEGHTDNVPIRTPVFPSNWELSAARAANVVRLFTSNGVDPTRLEIIGLGEHRPLADNGSVEGRNRNRRVVVVVLEAPEAQGDYAGSRQQAAPEEVVQPTVPVASLLTRPAAGDRAAAP